MPPWALSRDRVDSQVDSCLRTGSIPDVARMTRMYTLSLPDKGFRTVIYWNKCAKVVKGAQESPYESPKVLKGVRKCVKVDKTPRITTFSAFVTFAALMPPGALSRARFFTRESRITQDSVCPEGHKPAQSVILWPSAGGQCALLQK